MKLSTRLLVPLLPTVAVVMLLYAAWAVHQRQATLLPQAKSETQVYATALALALEFALRDGKLDDVQEIIDQVSADPDVYGVIVYDVAGQALYVSKPLSTDDAMSATAFLRSVEEGGRRELERELLEERVYSVMRPLHGPDGRVVGTLEVAQPLSFVEAETARTSQRFLLNTLTLFAALTFLILWLVRRSISQPLERFISAARALGRGELSYRVSEDPGGAELVELAREFNRMAAQLELARTDLIREAEERVALERRLRDTEKLAAVGTVAAGVAHQIAAPLNVIGGRAQKLLKRGMNDSVEERNLQIIGEQIERITVIVRNLLDFARRPEPRLRALDLGQLIDDVVELLEGEFASANVSVAWESPEALQVLGDPDLLHQVFVNLFVNALEALEVVEGERAIEISTERYGDRVAVEIADSGPGIPADVVPRIFEPFFTTKADGTGLGLALARGIVRELGGQLETSEAPSGGALFRLTLPAAESVEAAHV